jgi:P27 family predicted phage terminase small subunit
MSRHAQSDKEKELKGTKDPRYTQKDTSGWTKLDYVSKSARKHLTDEQAAIFTMVSTELINAGLYYKKDVPMIIAYAKFMTVYYAAMEDIEQNGSVTTMTNGPQVIDIISPHWKVANDAWQRANTIGDRLGLNLIAMNRIPTKAPQKKQSALSVLMNPNKEKKA